MRRKRAPQIFNKSCGECTTAVELCLYAVRYISLMVQIAAVPGDKPCQLDVFQIFLKATIGANPHFLSNGCRNEYNRSCKQADQTGSTSIHPQPVAPLIGSYKVTLKMGNTATRRTFFNR